MNESKLLAYAKREDYEYDMVYRIGEWNGYDVWSAGYSDGIPRYTGEPLYMLVRGEEISTASIDEMLEINRVCLGLGRKRRRRRRLGR